MYRWIISFFAEKNGIAILRHYIDRAFSAKTDNRPEFQAMIKDSGKRLFDMILVWKLDRFARNRYDSARYKTTLKKNGVKVVSATEVISDGAEGIILESVLEGYAEYYSADLSEKVVRGMTENALKSKYNGGTLPLGYQIDSDQYFQLDPLTAPFVREAFQRYDEGATMTAIRDWLNEQDVKNTRGQKITYNCVQHLLNNRRYIGEYSYRDIVVLGGIPVIIPQDPFDRVQEKLAKNKKAPARHKAEDDYLLTTKLFCGYCGAYLCGESGTSHMGNTHRYYKCVSVKKKRQECHKKPAKKEWIEDLVVNETMEVVMEDKTIEANENPNCIIQVGNVFGSIISVKGASETRAGIASLPIVFCSCDVPFACSNWSLTCPRPRNSPLTFSFSLPEKAAQTLPERTRFRRGRGGGSRLGLFRRLLHQQLLGTDRLRGLHLFTIAAVRL